MIRDKIKKTFISMGIAIGALTTKSFGYQAFYGPPPGIESPPQAGGIEADSLLDVFSRVGAVFAVPVVIIVGIIVYLIKKKK